MSVPLFNSGRRYFCVKFFVFLYEMRLRIINQRGEDNNQISIRYLADHSEVEGSIPAEPRLEDLYLWLFPQEDVEREGK